MVGDGCRWTRQEINGFLRLLGVPMGETISGSCGELGGMVANLGRCMMIGKISSEVWKDVVVRKK
jgi:hypothetical protein